MKRGSSSKQQQSFTNSHYKLLNRERPL